jgi:protein-disulfide isomerase
MSSPKEQKDALRAERRQREDAAQTAQQRRRRLITLGGAVGLAALVLVVAIVISQSGSSDDSSGSAGGDTAAVQKEFAGIPQKRSLLGSAGAPATLIEYADLQCPFCAQYSNDVLPTVLKEYVRNEKLRLELRLLTFIGPDSKKAAQTAAAASLQNRLWQFTDLFYRNQGTENTGYVTDSFLKEIADATPGLDAQEAIDQSGSARARAIVAAWGTAGQEAGVNSTPSFYLQAPGGTPQQLQVDSLDPGSFTSRLDDALATL